MNTGETRRRWRTILILGAALVAIVGLAIAVSRATPHVPSAPANPTAPAMASAQADFTSLLGSVGDIEQGCLSRWSRLSTGAHALVANSGTGGSLLVKEATAAEPDCNTALSGVSSTSVPDSLRGYPSVVTWLGAAQDQVSALWDAVSRLEQLGRTVNHATLREVTIALDAVTSTTAAQNKALVQAKHDLDVP